VAWRINSEHASSRAAQKRAILVASHDAARAGSQLILLEIVRELAMRDDLEIFLLMLWGGEIATEFENQVHTLQLDRFAVDAGVDVQRALELVLEHFAESAPMMALCNTVASSDVAVGCARLQIPVLSLIHELPTSIDSAIGSDKLRALVRSSRRLIVASGFVQDALAKHYGLDRARLLPMHTGVLNWDHSPGFRQRCRDEVRAEFDLPEDAFLVLGCGTIHHRKGTDLFVQVAREIAAMDGIERMFFLWIGPDQTGPQFRQWCEHDIQAAGLSGRVRLAGGRVDTASYFGAADAFALTSREDPFPMVNLEAMARGVPVVAFADAGGAVEVLTQRAGIVVPYLDVKAMAREIVALCEAPHYHAEIADAARRRIATHHRWRDYVDRLVSIFESDFGYRS
jgi:glycosyltransferase involved in cell wall biosynthesis